MYLRGLTSCHQNSTILIAFLWMTLLLQSFPGNGESIGEIIQDFNEEYKIQMNVFLDINGRANDEFEGIMAKLEVPKISINSADAATQNLYKEFNMHILTIARVDKRNLNGTLKAMDSLLWRRHFTNIIVKFDSQDEDLANLIHLFRGCWQQGHTSVLVWWNNKTFTYTPYPHIEVIPLQHLSYYKDRSAFNNFHRFKIATAFIDYPPRCFSYHNPKGELIRTGYYYKIIEDFVNHYNGTLRPRFVDAWGISFNQQSINDLVQNQGFSFIATHLVTNENYESSDSVHFGKCYLIVPSGKEIDQYMYLLVSFDRGMWFMVGIILVILFVGIAVINYSWYGKRNLSESFLQSLQVICFIHGQIFERKTFFNFLLHLLFLCIGLFLTNSYICNLSSMYTSRIYEPDLEVMKDIARTNLGIHTYSLDYKQYMALENLPAIIYERLYVGNNTVFNVNRQKLNMVDIYMAMDDIADLLFFQQLYLKRPLATYISEPMYTIPIFVTTPHRLAFIDLFNQHLSHLKDSGILSKFRADSKWDGVLSSRVQFLQDVEANRALSMAYLQYAFVMLSIGLLISFIGFLFEIFWKRRCNNKKK